MCLACMTAKQCMKRVWFNKWANVSYSRWDRSGSILIWTSVNRGAAHAAGSIVVTLRRQGGVNDVSGRGRVKHQLVVFRYIFIQILNTIFRSSVRVKTAARPISQQLQNRRNATMRANVAAKLRPLTARQARRRFDEFHFRCAAYSQLSASAIWEKHVTVTWPASLIYWSALGGIGISSYTTTIEWCYQKAK